MTGGLSSVGMIKKSITQSVCLACFAAFASCTNSMQEIADVTGNAKPGTDRGEDVTILYSKGGHLSARLFAHTFIRADGANPPYTEMQGGLKVEFFNDSLKVKSVLTARYARWYEKQNNILIRDSVRIVNDKGDTLTTPEMVWNQQLNQFFTEKPVKIITPTQTLYGTGMEAAQDFGHYTIHNLTGKVEVEKAKLPR